MRSILPLRWPLAPTVSFLAGCAAALAPQAGEALPPFPVPSGEDRFEPIRQGDDDAHAYDAPFFAIDGRAPRYDPSVPSPDALLGRPVGSRLAHHEEIVGAFRQWAALSPRLRVERHATTFEGRELVYVLISSAENLARIEEIRAAIHRLWDPRGLADAEAEHIVASTPAIAWVGYSIHGDETSGADASLAVAHHLIASQDEEVAALLDDVVVVMDPVMNPDGRERFLAMVEQSAGYVTNLDYASMHRGRWPYGRGNHYLFDMNRDWMAGIAPETRGRWSVALAYHPQLFVDGHEMGALDTFLFYPQADPHLPSLPPELDAWQKRFADDAAAAFDRMGWAYYTREWADAWCPFYSDAWGSLNGAIGMLYEQARYGGAPVRRASGVVTSYRQAVHAQALATMSNLATLARERAQLLTDYLATRRHGCDASAPGGERAFVLVPGANASRELALLDTLVAQGVEVWRAAEPLAVRDAESALGERATERSFPAGSFVVPRAQPQGALVEAYLGFDPRMDDAFLLEERTKLERDGSSKIYDVTAWDLGRAFGVDAWWATSTEGVLERVDAAFLEQALATAGRVLPPPSGAAPWGWIVDGGDDASVRFAAHALDLGGAVHLADEPFAVAEHPGRTFPRGSLLVRRGENAANVDELVARAAASARAEVLAISSGRAPADGPDLGGGHFQLLARPRIALLANAPIAREGFGHVWHFLDQELRVPVTLLDVQDAGAYDLRRYNVLVVPPSGGWTSVVEPMKDDLRAWISAGGTLVACGEAAAELASSDLGLTAVRERSDVLDELEEWQAAADREMAARTVTIDPRLIWEGVPTEPALDEDADSDAAAGDGEESSEREDDDAEEEGDGEPAAARERWMRRFSPSGAYLRGLVDEESWLAFGCGPTLPVFFYGDHALLSRAPVRTPVRLAPARELRIAGLVWPEARERLAGTAWLTRERLGNGQVVLFASPPAFRGHVRATLRMLANAVIYGPGMGANQPVDW